MKERITITLDEELIRQIDKRIDGEVIKNRSQEIETVLLDALGSNKPKKAVLLCGGLGERLKPLTNDIPKALIKIGKKTVTEHLLDLFKKYGITEMVFCVGHFKEKIMDYFGDGSNFGVSIDYVEENKPLGTAGPLRLAKHLLKESFIVANGDELKDINISRMFRLHKRKNAKATIALTTVSDPSNYGSVCLSGSRVVKFVEKPKKGEEVSNLISAGFYILEPSVLDMIPEGKSMLEKEVFPKLAENQEIRGFPFEGQWYDIGNISRLETARKLWKGLL